MDLLGDLPAPSSEQKGSSFQSSNFGFGDDNINIPPSEPEPDVPKLTVWNFKFYQQFFDIDTDEVVLRLRHSLIPSRNVNFFQNIIKSKPDMYGPFWISVTLIFTVAITGNLANYLQAAATKEFHWKYDFHAVTFAAMVVFMYAWILPIGLWVYLKWHGHIETRLSILDLICVYGYCLSVYIPVSILWVIQIGWFQWLLVIVGAVTSGTILISSVNSVLLTRNYFLLAFVFIMHILLAMCFMLYFFHVHSSDPSHAIPIPVGNASQVQH